MKNILLKAENARKEFYRNEEKITVLNDISTELYEGDFTVVMGASGAGKSTLLYALSGMDKITSGSVKYKNKEISGLSDKEISKLRINDFGFVFQQTHLVSSLTLFENVAAAGYLNKKIPREKTAEKASELLKKMNVADAENRRPAQVSGGEAQRAALARAMINEPALIFADEPTGALNKANTDEVLDLLTEINSQGQSVLMVTHDVRAAIRGNRIIYLEDGKIINELLLPPYDKRSARSRELELNEWLSNLRW